MTEHRALARQVAEQKRQYQTLVEHLPDAIIRFDPALRQVYVSPRAETETILRIATAERVGKTYAELGVPAAQYGPWEQAMRHVFATGEPSTLDTTSPIGDGDTSLHYYRLRYIPEFGADGDVESVLSITTDMTELKRTELALRQTNTALEAARQEEERRAQTAESLRGVLAVLNSNQAPQEVLQYIVRQAKELLGTTAAVLYGPDRLTDSLSPEAPLTALRVQAAQGLRLGGALCSSTGVSIYRYHRGQALASAEPVALLSGVGNLSPRAAQAARRMGLAGPWPFRPSRIVARAVPGAAGGPDPYPRGELWMSAAALHAAAPLCDGGGGARARLRRSGSPGHLQCSLASASRTGGGRG